MPAITLEPTTPTVPATRPRREVGSYGPERCHRIDKKAGRCYCGKPLGPPGSRHPITGEQSPCPACGNPKCLKCQMAWRRAKGKRL